MIGDSEEVLSSPLRNPLPKATEPPPKLGGKMAVPLRNPLRYFGAKSRSHGSLFVEQGWQHPVANTVSPLVFTRKRGHTRHSNVGLRAALVPGPNDTATRYPRRPSTARRFPYAMLC